MMTMYVLLVNYLRPLEEVQPLFPAHREFLQRYYASGQFIVSGTREGGGLIVAKIAGGREAVDAIVAEDPFTVQGMATYEVMPFHPLWTAAGLEWLKK